MLLNAEPNYLRTYGRECAPQDTNSLISIRDTVKRSRSRLRLASFQLDLLKPAIFCKLIVRSAMCWWKWNLNESFYSESWPSLINPLNTLAFTSTRFQWCAHYIRGTYMIAAQVFFSFYRQCGNLNLAWLVWVTVTQNSFSTQMFFPTSRNFYWLYSGHAKFG